MRKTIMSEKRKHETEPAAPAAPAPDQSAPTGAPPPTLVEGGAVRKSPKDWAAELGHGPGKPGKNVWTGVSAVKGMSRQMGSMAYEVAAVLHGWREHEHHEGGPIQLTREEFEAALAAALPAQGDPEPHPPALSEHRGGGVRRRLVEGRLVKEPKSPERTEA